MNLEIDNTDAWLIATLMEDAVHAEAAKGDAADMTQLLRIKALSAKLTAAVQRSMNDVA
jgi:hypothetical protein